MNEVSLDLTAYHNYNILRSYPLAGSLWSSFWCTILDDFMAVERELCDGIHQNPYKNNINIIDFPGDKVTPLINL